ncbi:transcriptional regulator, LacI family [Agromyces sp. CF514]|uniref:LacI family DNA-binding transcriptional regulator n=1 Tax=Agromyces sp. CF514 TaxID=1881031 RepID=UPI0008ECAB5A|nr:LacI family DNA-binding transcriptional regulator [Agromyces sp. CF514]SFR83678.1 transcriptional regulator, LacI family [Agromyces sp. CF514]
MAGAATSAPLPPRARASVRDVAEATGLSIATVSRVLNGNAQVAPATRELVLGALEGLGSAAPIARGHSRQTGGPVFVRCPYVLTDYFGLIVSSIAEELAANARPMLLDAGESSQSRHPLGQMPMRAETSGAILILPPEDAAELGALRRHGFPFVIVDPRTRAPEGSVVVSAAHHQGARALTTHLLELGHRRIGVLAGPDEWLVSRERLAGHTAALAEVGVLQDPALVSSVSADVESGRVAAAELLTRADRPTALVCFNDKVAVGAMRAVQDAGLRVPEDVSVVGFDDSDLSRATTPGLTTVWQPLADMGRLAVTQLLRLISHERVDALHVELGTRLVVRESTAPVRGPR